MQQSILLTAVVTVLRTIIKILWKFDHGTIQNTFAKTNALVVCSHYLQLRKENTSYGYIFTNLVTRISKLIIVITSEEKVRVIQEMLIEKVFRRHQRNIKYKDVFLLAINVQN